MYTSHFGLRGKKKSHLTLKTIHEIDTIIDPLSFEGEGTEAQSSQWTCADAETNSASPKWDSKLGGMTPRCGLLMLG